MVIEGGARGRPVELALHLLRTDHNESVNVMAIWGVDAPDLYDAIREMHAIGAGAKSARTLYHANIDPREHEQFTEEQKRIAVQRLAEKLGFENQPRVVVEHVKKGRHHLHVVFGRIDLETMTAIPDSHNFRKHEELATELSREFEHAPVKRALTRDKERDGRPPQAPSLADYQQAARSGITPAQAKAQITEAWRQTTTGYDFRHRIEAEGYTLARGDRKDFVLLDQAGEIHGLTGRRVAGVKAAEIRERMADIEADTLPDVIQARRLVGQRQKAQEKAAALGFTSAAERLRAEELKREAEAKGGYGPRLSNADQEIADAIYQLGKTMKGQLENVVTGKPTYDQRQQQRAELEARPEMEAQPVRYESRDVMPKPEATGGGQQQQERPAERDDQAAAIGIDLQRSVTPPQHPQPIPKPEQRPGLSLLGRLFDWIRGHRPEATPAPADRAGTKRQEQAARVVAEPSPETIQRPSMEVEKPAEPLIRTPERESRPSAWLFVKVFGWLVDAYERAMEMASVHEMEKIEIHPQRQAPPESSRPEAKSISSAPRLPANVQHLEPRPTKAPSPAGPAAPKIKPAKRSLFDEVTKELAERTPEEIAREREGAQRLREQEERERQDYEREHDPDW